MTRTIVPSHIIRTVRAKSGNECSFPKCDVNLISADGKFVGEVCAIESFHPFNPRKRNDLTQSEYKSEDNFIFLCPTHHRLIDLDAQTYTVAFLHEIKKKHEQKIAKKPESPATKFGIPNDLSLSEILIFFENNIANDSEEFWQTFFSKHPSIISFIYPNPIVKIGEKAYVGGKSIDNTDGNIADFIFKKEISKSVVIVEIKTPQAKLLGKQYRANTYSISSELSGAIIQVINYKTELISDFFRLQYTSGAKFENADIHCIVIAGKIEDEFANNNQTKSLDLFRSTLNNLTVITFDELYSKLLLIKSLIT